MEYRVGLLFVLTIISGCLCSVEVSLESSVEGGFFLRQAAGGRAGGASEVPPPPPGSLVHTERFAVFQTSRPLSVRASYGPFSTKQTVPARSLVAEPSQNLTDVPWTSRHLDLSAHLVTKSVERDGGVVRVVMHTGGESGGRVCCVVHATFLSQSIQAACSPDQEGMCLVELQLPWVWFPPAAPAKTPPRHVSLSYTVVEPASQRSGGGCAPRVMIQPLTPLGSVQLLPASQPYTSITTDQYVKMSVPQRPLYPTSRLHIPTYISFKPATKITGIIMRARAKSGLKVTGAELVAKQDWNMTLETNSKQSVATVTLLLKQKDPNSSYDNKSEEVLVWEVEVAEASSGGLWQEGKLVWSIRYIGDKVPAQPPKHKSTLRVHINKDDVHALIPISKNWELVNSAVLTGKQVSQSMKVVMVSHGGRLADVTLQASCRAPDDSVIKVSSSCSSVYVDGSEVRGSANATVVISYDNLGATASFTVWMPELPVEVSIPDTRLSQVKGWRVIDTRWKGKVKRGVTVLTEEESDDSANTVDKTPSTPCRLNYQQTSVDVYARFVAVDEDSGRVSYLVNRRTWLRVTQLVLGLLRVADVRIATLRANILQGRAPGRTELQVVSAVSGRVLGAKEVRVVSDRVSVVSLQASVVSGLQLAISPDTSVDNGYIAQASVTRKLTAQYQEGLLDMEVEYSDGSRVSVSSLEKDEYRLLVETERPGVVAFAPQNEPRSQPRVIAVAPGSGNLLAVTLAPPLVCALSPQTILAHTHAHVEIEFSSTGMSVTRPELVQNDGSIHKEFSGDLHELIGSQLKDDQNHEPTMQARHHGGSGNGVAVHHAVLTPLEIGMYVLLAAFCFAIVVFVVSCVVYASRFKAEVEHPAHPIAPPAPTTNAHDWVWLGRNTMHITDNPYHHHHAVHHHPVHHLSTSPRNINIHDDEEGEPPEVPPHRPGALDTYRPPVPPHRAPSAHQPPLPKKHHHHHHHRRRGGQRPALPGNQMLNDNEVGVQPNGATCNGGLGLEQLSLAMDYNQIMTYFDSLKESNA